MNSEISIDDLPLLELCVPSNDDSVSTLGSFTSHSSNDDEESASCGVINPSSSVERWGVPQSPGTNAVLPKRASRGGKSSLQRPSLSRFASGSEEPKSVSNVLRISRRSRICLMRERGRASATVLPNAAFDMDAPEQKKPTPNTSWTSSRGSATSNKLNNDGLILQPPSLPLSLRRFASEPEPKGDLASALNLRLGGRSRRNPASGKRLPRKCHSLQETEKAAVAAMGSSSRSRPSRRLPKKCLSLEDTEKAAVAMAARKNLSGEGPVKRVLTDPTLDMSIDQNLTPQPPRLSRWRSEPDEGRSPQPPSLSRWKSEPDASKSVFTASPNLRISRRTRVSLMRERRGSDLPNAAFDMDKSYASQSHQRGRRTSDISLDMDMDGSSRWSSSGVHPPEMDGSSRWASSASLVSWIESPDCPRRQLTDDSLIHNPKRLSWKYRKDGGQDVGTLFKKVAALQVATRDQSDEDDRDSSSAKKTSPRPRAPRRQRSLGANAA